MSANLFCRNKFFFLDNSAENLIPRVNQALFEGLKMSVEQINETSGCFFVSRRKRVAQINARLMVLLTLAASRCARHKLY